MLGTIREADDSQRDGDALSTLGFRQPRQEQRQLDIAFGGEHGQQVVELKHETDVLRPPARELAAAERADALAADFNRAAARRIEPAHQVEQRRLARPRRAHQREKVASGNNEVDALQHVDALAAPRERFVHVRDADERHLYAVASDCKMSVAGTPSSSPRIHGHAHAVLEIRGNRHDDALARLETGDHPGRSPSELPDLTALPRR